MSEHAIFQDLVPVEVALDKIFLDPNNPRFRGANSQYVADDQIDNETVQDSARQRLIQYYAVEKLRMNMEVNGYLPIDRVIVREFATGRFVVLEGNRRICAAKLIADAGANGAEVSPEVLISVKTIPCLQYVGTDADASWVFQGIRHITGIFEWSAFNKAILLVEQMEEEGLNLTEAGKRFGLTAFGAGQWVRGYYAFKQARETSDYINEIDERSYPYFQELFSRSSASVREWLEWDESKRAFSNELNFNEFIGWLYPRIQEEYEEGSPETKGDFERRHLVRRDDIRSLAFLISKAPEGFQQFRSEGDLEKAYSMALAKKYEEQAKEEADPAAEVFDSIKLCTKALENIPFRLLRNDVDKARLLEALASLKNAMGALME